MNDFTDYLFNVPRSILDSINDFLRYMNTPESFQNNLRIFLWISLPFFFILAMVMTFSRKNLLDYFWTWKMWSFFFVVLSSWLITNTDVQFSYLTRNLIWANITLSVMCTLLVFMWVRFGQKSALWRRIKRKRA